MTMIDGIKVTIYCTAFNHEAYVGEALESFVGQKTDFPFEVLVTDDASTDRTTEIIRDYASRYPDIIRFFHQEENTFSQGRCLYDEVMYPNTRGDYVAYCEGDDFWCSDTKLQRQVDFLDSHPEYSACVHNSLYSYCGSEKKDEPVIKPRGGDYDVSFAQVIKGMSNCFHTSSILGRAGYFTQAPDFQRVAFKTAGFTDYPNALWLAMNGKIRFLDEPMSVYRVNSNPESWRSGVDASYGKKIRFVAGEIAMMESMLNHPALAGENRRLTEEELLKRNYELLYLEGRVEELVKPPYDSLYREEPAAFRIKTRLKLLFPGLHEAYRKRRGFK